MKTFFAIPECLQGLRDEKRWVVWRYEERKNKNGELAFTKPPLKAHGGTVGKYASNNDPNTWATLDEAIAAHATGRCDGVGLQLLGLEGFAAIDLDDVRDSRGDYSNWAGEIITRSKSYAENTPSGNGGRIIGFVSADFPSIHTRKSHAAGGHFELYVNLRSGSGRYITVTGDRLTDQPDIAADITTTIQILACDLAEQPIVIIDESAVREYDEKNKLSKLHPDVIEALEKGLTDDRSADFQSIVNHLCTNGWKIDEALSLFRQYPNGPAAKYNGTTTTNDRLERELKRSWAKASSSQSKSSDDSMIIANDDPVDLWSVFPPPELPTGLLPPLIENFSRVRAEQIGCDPSGIAISALACCAAAIPDRIRIKPKRYEDWFERACLWVAIVGPPSAKKSPIIRAASDPIKRIDAALLREYMDQLEVFNQLAPDEKREESKPSQTRIRIEDTTVEAAQQVLLDSPQGVLCLQDELSGFFGAMEKYNNRKGASVDRAFYLQAYNGGEYAVNRVGRGAHIIPNLSMCILGGIQPEPIRSVANDTSDDGLIQRFIMIVLRPAESGKDEPKADIARNYDKLIKQLHSLMAPALAETGYVEFDDAAQSLRNDLEKHYHELISAQFLSARFAAHIGKYDGMYARMCLIFHCIEYVCSDEYDPVRPIPDSVSHDIALRVKYFFEQFILPHAAAFYSGVLGLSDDHETLRAIAGHILAHKLTKVTHRDVQRGSRLMRGLKDAQIRALLEQLAALGWLEKADAPKPTSPAHWNVNPVVHQKYLEQAANEKKRIENAKIALKHIFSKRN
jgi:hypothetical protein